MNRSYFMISSASPISAMIIKFDYLLLKLWLEKFPINLPYLQIQSLNQPHTYLRMHQQFLHLVFGLLLTS